MPVKNLSAKMKVEASAFNGGKSQIRVMVEHAANNIFGQLVDYVTEPDPTGNRDSRIVFKGSTKIGFDQLCMLSMALGTSKIDVYHEEERDLIDDGTEPSSLEIWVHDIRGPLRPILPDDEPVLRFPPWPVIPRRPGPFRRLRLTDLALNLLGLKP